jgi:hypothetical protein
LFRFMGFPGNLAILSACLKNRRRLLIIKFNANARKI